MRLKPRRFWTPRYLADRVLLAAHQRRHPDLPWWPREAIGHLEDMLRPTDRCLEWGSGRSTAWLAERTASVMSIEHDTEWFDAVSVQLAEHGLPEGSVRLLDAGPVERPEESPYVRVVDEFGDGEIDVCIVDGRYRGKCAVAALPKIARGGLLIVDDANWFLERSTRSPHSRNGRGPRDEDWRHFAEAVRDWRCVWTSDGVTDTAIWIRP